MKRILILYTSVGLGHKYIAHNIAYHLEKDGYVVLLKDILEVQEGWLVDVGTWLHSFINRRAAFLWRWLYFSELINFLLLPLRVPLAKTNSENLSVIVKQFNPDCIISTQTTSSSATVALIRQKKFLGKFVIAFSDYHLHKFWLYDEADLYLANTVEQKTEMIQMGILQNKIVVCGITLQPLEIIDKKLLKQKLQIPVAHKVVMFASGSLGIGFNLDMLRRYFKSLLDIRKDLTILVITGKNINFYNQILKIDLPSIKPLQFRDDILSLLQITDVLLTKPGGLSIAEALQANTEIIITHTLPGQEEPNYTYLLDKKLVSEIPSEPFVDNLVKLTLEKLTSNTKPSLSASMAITQKGHEGEVVLGAVKQLFHNV